MDETYRKYHAGKYPAKEGGPGEASYEEGSSYGSYKQDENGQPIIKAASGTEEGVDVTATRMLRKILGVTKTGEKGQLGGMRTKKALEE